MQATEYYTANRYAKHPAKALYLTYQLLSTLLVRLPFWIITSIPPSLRPRRDWSFIRCLEMRAITHVFVISNEIGGLGGLIKSPNYLAIAPGTDIDAEWIEPDPSLVLGQLAAFATTGDVEPHRIPGYWLHQRPSDRVVQPGEKVLFCLHGGGYTSGSASPGDTTAAIPRGVLESTPSVKHAFSPEYRLSTSEGNAFPAAIVDAVAGYAHLLRKHRVSPKDVIIEGDSAGGNLALAVTRYLVEYREQLEPLGLAPPSALLLMSPWADLGLSHLSPNPPGYFERTDYIIIEGKGAEQRFSQVVYAGPAGLSILDTNPYISPASKALKKPPSFKGWPRTFISCGGGEALGDPIRLLGDRMAADLNESGKPDRLTFYEASQGVHDYVAFTFFEPERTDTLKAIAAWVESA